MNFDNIDRKPLALALTSESSKSLAELIVVAFPSLILTRSIEGRSATFEDESVLILEMWSKRSQLA